MRMLGFIFMAGLVACSSGDPAFEVPFVPTEPGSDSTATIIVHLKIDGDPAMLGVGSVSYFVSVDNSHAEQIFGNLVLNLHIAGGYHDVKLTRVGPYFFFAPPPPPWCDPVPPLAFGVSVLARSSTEVTFHVSCPLREGTGSVRLNLSAAGPNAPASAQVYFLSQISPQTLKAVVVPVNKETTVALTPGVYRFGVDVPSCPFASGPYSALPAPFLLREDGIKDISLTLPCKL